MRYLLRKLGLYAFIAWAAITLNFLIPRMMPGDPVELLLEKSQGQLAPEAVADIRKAFGLTDEPMIVQYWDYLVKLSHGDLGRSLAHYPVPVSEIVGAAMPWTVTLIGVTTIISFLLGTGLGVLLSWRRGTWTDHLLVGLTFLNALPYFWMALIFVMVFAVNLGWFPTAGGYDPRLVPDWDQPFVTSVLYRAILPALTIIIASFAGWVMGMRNMTVTTLGEDYVALAEAKGLPKRMVMLRYAARNAILPSVTSFALSLGHVVGGSMLTEVIFNYPGVGYALFTAVNTQDFPLMQGMFLIISMAVILANLVADFLYVLLDPRTREA